MSPSIPWADVVEVGASMLTADVRDRVGLPQGPFDFPRSKADEEGCATG